MEGFELRTRDPINWVAGLADDQATELIILASLNRNGFVREAAIKQMGVAKNVRHIPFLLERLGDWVQEVREAASSVLEGYLQPAFLGGFLDALEVVIGLRRVQRVDLQPWHDRVMEWVLSVQDYLGLLNEIRSLREGLRAYVVRHMLSGGSCDAEVVDLLSEDRSPLVRLHAYRHAGSHTGPYSMALLEKGCSDTFAAIRSVCLRALIKRGAASPQLLDRFLTDRAADLRKLARERLGWSAEDLQQHYYQALEDPQLRAGALVGLAEVGSDTDAPLIASFVKDKDRHIRYAALKGLDKIATNRARELASDLLEDPSHKVREKAIQIMLRHHDRGVYDRARVLLDSDRVRPRLTGLTLMSRYGGWQPLPDILNVCFDSDPVVAGKAWRALDVWIDYARNLFTKPDQADIERAHQALDRHRAAKQYPELILNAKFDRIEQLLDSASERV